MPSGTELDRLTVLIEVENDKFNRGVADADKALDKFLKTVADAGMSIHDKFEKALARVDGQLSRNSITVDQHVKRVDALKKAYMEAAEAADKAAKAEKGSGLFSTALDKSGFSGAAIQTKLLEVAAKFGTDLGEHFGGRDARNLEKQTSKGEHLDTLSRIQQSGVTQLAHQKVGQLNPAERNAERDRLIKLAQDDAANARTRAKTAGDRYEFQAGLGEHNQVSGFFKRQVGDKLLGQHEAEAKETGANANKKEEEVLRLQNEKKLAADAFEHSLKERLRLSTLQLNVDRQIQAQGSRKAVEIHTYNAAREAGADHEQATVEAANAKASAQVRENTAVIDSTAALERRNKAYGNMALSAKEAAREAQRLEMVHKGILPGQIHDALYEQEKAEKIDKARSTKEQIDTIERRNQAYGNMALTAKQAARELERLNMIHNKEKPSQISEKMAVHKREDAIASARSVQDTIEGMDRQIALMKDRNDIEAKYHSLLKDVSAEHKKAVTEQLKQKDLQVRGQALVEKYKTPQEKYDQEIKDLNEIYEASDKGAKAQHAFAMAAREAQEHLDRAPRKFGAEGLKMGSVDAMAKIDEYRRKFGQKNILPASVVAQQKAAQAAKARADIDRKAQNLYNARFNPTTPRDREHIKDLVDKARGGVKGGSGAMRKAALIAQAHKDYEIGMAAVKGKGPDALRRRIRLGNVRDEKLQKATGLDYFGKGWHNLGPGGGGRTITTTASPEIKAMVDMAKGINKLVAIEEEKRRETGKETPLEVADSKL